tara:strand:+ start:86 stop:1027 length:942 start_codon:yes stop_codon:yes gene_type:complete
MRINESLVKKTLKEFFPKKFLLETSSGTSSLIISLEILKNKFNNSRNEVILPSVCCPSVLSAVSMAKLKPIFVDMEFKRFNMSLEDIKKKINKNTLTVICVHSFGIAADVISIKRILKKKKIPLIEDACLIFGGKYENKEYFGNFGDFGIFSFGYEKIIDVNSGGLLVINDYNDFVEAKNFLRKNVFFSKKIFKNKLFKQKLDNISKSIKSRKLNSLKFDQNLNSKNIIKPVINDNDVIWRYSLIVKNKKKLIQNAKKKNLIITEHYPSINRFQSNSNLKNARIFNNGIINLFVKEGTSENYINRICNLINRI